MIITSLFEITKSIPLKIFQMEPSKKEKAVKVLVTYRHATINHDLESLMGNFLFFTACKPPKTVVTTAMSRSLIITTAPHRGFSSRLLL